MRNHGSWSRRVGIVLAGTLLAMLNAIVPSGVAQAEPGTPPTVLHYVQYDWDPGCGRLGLSRCGYSYVTANHRTVGACDTYADGIGLWTQYYTTSGASGYVADPNGSDPDCGTRSPGVIDRFRPCRHHENDLIVCLETWRYVT